MMTWMWFRRIAVYLLISALASVLGLAVLIGLAVIAMVWLA